MSRRRPALAALGVLCACSTPDSHQSYLFVWAQDSAKQASNFIGVIEANPASPTYGSIVASVAAEGEHSHAHHTEAEMPASGHLLANAFHAGDTWVFDLTKPLEPRVMTSFGALAGFSNPHTYFRQANGNVLATFQYAAEGRSTHAQHDTARVVHRTGGIVEMDERGNVLRSASARDTTIADSQIFPYSVLPVPAIDRAIVTTTDMDDANKAATSEWVQVWRLSDLTRLRTFALAPGPRGTEHQFTGEARLLPDGKSVYIHTFSCGLYLARDLDTDAPRAMLVRSFEGTATAVGACGVPLLIGHYWVQPVGATHSLVSLDVSEPEHPREVNTLKIADDEYPHWLALDPTGKRIVVNSAGAPGGNRLFVVNFDSATGRLSLDEKFRDAGAARPGVTLSGRTWPHGFTGTALPHGVVFSR